MVCPITQGDHNKTDFVEFFLTGVNNRLIVNFQRDQQKYIMTPPVIVVLLSTLFFCIAVVK